MKSVPDPKSQRNSTSFLQRCIRYAGRFIDYPTAFAGAVIMGLVVGVINRKFGIWPASTAAMKQAVYTFFFGGMLTRLLYIIGDNIPGKYTSIFFSAFIVTIITVGLVYLVHNFRGTPLPFESTLPTALLAPFGFTFLAYRRKRMSNDKRLMNKETS